MTDDKIINAIRAAMPKGLRELTLDDDISAMVATLRDNDYRIVKCDKSDVLHFDDER